MPSRKTEKPLVNLRKAYSYLDGQVRAQAASASRPRTVHQYWDADLPEDVGQLISHNRKLCEKRGVEHVLWNDHSALEFLEQHDPRALGAYEACPHPAMKCDLFRLVLLAVRGGTYLDADMSLEPGAFSLWHMPGDLIVFKWNKIPKDGRSRRKVSNSIIIAREGSRTLASIAEVVISEMQARLKESPADALQNIGEVSGPKIFTRALAQSMLHDDFNEDIVIIDAQFRSLFVGYGRGVLGKSELDYKSTDRAWQKVARRGKFKS